MKTYGDGNFWGPATSEEIADFVEESADYMERHGSCSGSYRNSKYEVCMEGAIGYVAESLRTNNHYRQDYIKDVDRVRWAATHLLDRYNIHTHGLGTTAYNDSASHQERLDALRKFAKVVRMEQI